ncbi:MAG: HAMP domain-containing protein, partial [Gemmatimonadetes bacterium]|nr:HAMP domain-containing protein [Gemmatimonadota bacterium]
MRAPSRIRRRIATAYAVAAGLVLVMTVVLVRGIARATIEQEFGESLDASVQLVRGFFRAEVKEFRTVPATVYHIGGETVFADRRLTFMRPDGSVAEVAPGRASEAPPLAPPVRDTIAPLDPELAPGWTVRVQHSQAVVQAFERRLDLWVLAGTPVLLALSALVGWLLAARALAPVGAMAEAAERVDAARASERLPVADPDDELGRLATRFNAVLERLDGALSQQRRFLAAAAHELRTPIARLRATLELSRAEGDAATRATLLAQADAEVTRTAQLVDELMQLARADANAAEVHLAPGFVDDVVTDVVASFGPLAKQRGVTLEVVALEEAPALLDARMFGRLVGTLVENGLRYTPAGGRVEISVTRAGDRARL